MFLFDWIMFHAAWTAESKDGMKVKGLWAAGNSAVPYGENEGSIWLND
jgi:hypothetical protein